MDLSMKLESGAVSARYCLVLLCMPLDPPDFGWNRELLTLTEVPVALGLI